MNLFIKSKTQKKWLIVLLTFVTITIGIDVECTNKGIKIINLATTLNW